MNADQRRDAFFSELDKLRDLPVRVDGPEIARISRRVGLSPHEALHAMRRNTPPFGHEKGTDTYDALAAFVSNLCKLKKSARVLEYTCTPSLLSARFAEGGEPGRIGFVAPNALLAESLSILFDGKVTSIQSHVESLDANARFDVVVCQPPIGNRRSGADADGFGGEVVRQLAPFVAEGGILCWVPAMRRRGRIAARLMAMPHRTVRPATARTPARRRSADGLALIIGIMISGTGWA